MGPIFFFSRVVLSIELFNFTVLCYDLRYIFVKYNVPKYAYVVWRNNIRKNISIRTVFSYHFNFLYLSLIHDQYQSLSGRDFIFEIESKFISFWSV